MADYWEEPIKIQFFYLPPAPTIQVADFGAHEGQVSTVSATSDLGGYANSDTMPTTVQNDTQRQRRAKLIFFRYGTITDDHLKLIYGPGHDGSEEEKLAYARWHKRMKDSVIQQLQTGMINLAPSWWTDFVRGETHFDDMLKVINNLALRWRELTVAVPLETPNEAAARTSKAARFHAE